MFEHWKSLWKYKTVSIEAELFLRDLIDYEKARNLFFFRKKFKKCKTPNDLLKDFVKKKDKTKYQLYEWVLRLKDRIEHDWSNNLNLTKIETELERRDYIKVIREKGSAEENKKNKKTMAYKNKKPKTNKIHIEIKEKNKNDENRNRYYELQGKGYRYIEIIKLKNKHRTNFWFPLISIIVAACALTASLISMLLK